jgi:GNAT superfamily N-acetyltransferase
VYVREARPEDWPHVAGLLAELGRPDVRETPDESAAREIFLAYIARPDVVVLVAERDGRMIGFLDMEFRTRLNFTTPQAWIPDLIVSEFQRSGGIGAALLHRAEELARDRGCWGMALESATWRERAHDFYEREGWSDSGKSFFKSLSDRQWPPAPR